MNKIFIFLFAFCVSFAMVGCNNSQSTLSPTEQYKLAAQKYIDNGDIETAINALKEGITITGDADLKAMLAELEAKNQMANTAKETKVETTPTNQIVDLLPTFSADERKSLNVFLSNFSEAYFSNYSQTDYTNEQLINFAFTHNNINNYSKIKYLGSEMGISFQDVNTTLERYLGKTVPSLSTEKWTYRDGLFYTPAATGETYAYFSVASKVIENPDGTLDVSFSIFIDENNTQEVSLEKWYSNSIEQAEGLCTKQENGTAKVRTKTYNGKPTYELISYALHQEQPVRENQRENLDFSIYEGEWCEKGFDWHVGGYTMSIEVDTYKLIIDCNFVSSPPQNRIANFTSEISMSDIKNNSVAVPFQDSWNNYGTLTLTFSNDCIQCTFENIVRDSHAMWGYDNMTRVVYKN